MGWGGSGGWGVVFRCQCLTSGRSPFYRRSTEAASRNCSPAWTPCPTTSPRTQRRLHPFFVYEALEQSVYMMDFCKFSLDNRPAGPPFPHGRPRRRERRRWSERSVRSVPKRPGSRGGERPGSLEAFQVLDGVELMLGWSDVVPMLLGRLRKRNTSFKTDPKSTDPPSKAILHETIVCHPQALRRLGNDASKRRIRSVSCHHIAEL